jgi:hypothetical protein
MKIDNILEELEILRNDNKRFARRLEELELKNKLLQNKIDKIKLLLNTQISIVNH